MSTPICACCLCMCAGVFVWVYVIYCITPKLCTQLSHLLSSHSIPQRYITSHQWHYRIAWHRIASQRAFHRVTSRRHTATSHHIYVPVMIFFSDIHSHAHDDIFSRHSDCNCRAEKCLSGAGCRWSSAVVAVIVSSWVGCALKTVMLHRTCRTALSDTRGLFGQSKCVSVLFHDMKLTYLFVEFSPMMRTKINYLKYYPQSLLKTSSRM